MTNSVHNCKLTVAAILVDILVIVHQIKAHYNSNFGESLMEVIYVHIHMKFGRNQVKNVKLRVPIKEVRQTEGQAQNNRAPPNVGGP